MKPVIICGGVGTKMWPESRQSLPKHFLPLIKGKSLFQINWEDLRKKFKPEEIFVDTNPAQAELAMKQVPEIVKENILLEPEVRNTGPAIGLIAALMAKKGYGDEPFMLIQADDLRKPAERLFDMIDVLGKFALSTDKYITGCIKPDRVVRGVDYLVKGKLLSNENGINVYEVADFIDRSEEEKLQKYIGTDELMIHSNHTSMTPNNYLKMYQKYRTDWYEPLMKIVNCGDTDSNFREMPKGMQEELTQKVHRDGNGIMVELPFDWIDFGTWESLMKYMIENELHEEEGLQEIDAYGNFVRRYNGKHVALLGVKDLIVIDTEDALLICDKNLTGRVGEIVNELKTEGKTELL